jgi:hypothetical protein
MFSNAFSSFHKVLLVLIIRNDDFTVMKGGEGIRKHRGEESYGCSLRVDYNEFKKPNTT